jgi:carbon-monoxide dehydrogenase medium subunit
LTEFIQPDSLAEAIDMLSRDPDASKVIAGGTAVVLMLQQKLIAPECLISLERISGLNSIRLENGNLHIGALTLLREVQDSLSVWNRCPALGYACSVVGNVRVRNQATLGGNLAEADYASDPPSVLLALNTIVTATGPSGSRAIPLSQFILGFYTTALEPDELITDIAIPWLPADTRMTYLKYRSRSSEDRPCVGVAAVATFDAHRCVDLRVAVGAACETPRRLHDVEAWANGHPLSDELVREIADGYAAQIETLDDLRGSSWYRKEMIRVHVRRALEEVRRDGGR